MSAIPPSLPLPIFDQNDDPKELIQSFLRSGGTFPVITRYLKKQPIPESAENAIRLFNYFLCALECAHQEKSTEEPLIQRIFLSHVKHPGLIEPLHVYEALKTHRTALASYFLKNGFSLNSSYGANGDTLLHLCSRKGDLESLEWIVQQGAKLEIRNTRGETALHQAGSIECVDFLLKAGLHIEDTTLAGYRPLHYAASKSGPILKHLLDRGAMINATTPEGLSALHIACLEKNEENLMTLLDSGADYTLVGKTDVKFQALDACFAVAPLFDEKEEISDGFLEVVGECLNEGSSPTSILIKFNQMINTRVFPKEQIVDWLCSYNRALEREVVKECIFDEISGKIKISILLSLLTDAGALYYS